MTWREASEHARLWIDRKQFRKDQVTGIKFDLEELFKGFPTTPPADLMLIFSAASRLLRKRNANTNLHEIDPLTAKRSIKSPPGVT